MIVPASVVGAAILLAVRLFRGASPRLRHALVTIALLKFVVPPLVTLPASTIPGWRIPLLLHAAGTLFMLGRLAVALWRLRRIRLRAEDAGAFLVSDEIDVPMTTGGAVLIPRALLATLSEDELRDVLAHEREHIRRRDVQRGLIDRCIVALWWFHPLVHLLAAEARALREECCDDALLASGTCAPAHYARTLLRAATHAAGRTPVAAAAVAESPHALLRRVRRMAAPRFAPSARLGLAATLLVILAALLLLPGLSPSRHGYVHHIHIH